MSAAEHSLELDGDDNKSRILFSPLNKGKDGAESKIPEPENVVSESDILVALKMPKKSNIVSETAKSEAELKIPNYKDVISGTTVLERPLVTSYESMGVSSSIPFRESDKKTFIQPVSQENIGFTFPIASESCSLRQQPRAPTLSIPLLNQPALQKEQPTCPVFCSSSSTSCAFSFSSTTTAVNDTKVVNFDEGSVPEIKSSTSHTTTAEGSNSSKDGQAQDASDLFKSIKNAVSSGLSMSTTHALFTFGDTITSPSLTNSSLGSSSSTFALSSTPAIALFGSPASSFSLSGTSMMPNTSPYLSSPTPVFSTVATFEFKSGTSKTSTHAPMDKSESSMLEAEPAKTSPFSASNSTSLGTYLAPSMSSSSTTRFAFSSNAVPHRL